VPHATADWKAAGVTFGHCCSKKQTLFGSTLHLLLTQRGVIHDVELASANVADLEAVLSERCRHLRTHPELVAGRVHFHWWPDAPLPTVA
jgi:hypothetical protein